MLMNALANDADAANAANATNATKSGSKPYDERAAPPRPLAKLRLWQVATPRMQA
jgi:hypothetical protein